MKILIVEDDRLTAEVYSGLLTKRGHEVTVVLDGSDAFHTIHTQQFELIVLDLMLPNMDGLAMLGRIRAQSKYQSLPILVMTAQTETMVLNKAKAAGATEVLIKGDVSPDQLADMIDHFQAAMPRKAPAPTVDDSPKAPAPSAPSLLGLKMVQEPKPAKPVRFPSPPPSPPADPPP